MARKSIGYVEMVWTCPNCGTKNPGSSRTCSNCGTAMPETTQFEHSVDSKIITDKEKIEEAKQGPDIYCAYCGARNPAGSNVCIKCGASLSEGKSRTSGKIYQADDSKIDQSNVSGTIICPNCGAENPSGSLKCDKCGSPLTNASYIPESNPSSSNTDQNSGENTGNKKNKKGCCIIFVILILSLIAIFFFMRSSSNSGLSGNSIFDSGENSGYSDSNSSGFSNIPFSQGQSNYGEMSAEVSSKSWKTSVKVRALVNESGEDWKDQIPSNADIGNCEQKVRSESDEEIDGAKEVCGPVQYEDKGNGYAEAFQDCKYYVYDDYCTYTYQDWSENEIRTNTGTSRIPQLPDLSSNEEKISGSESVTFEVDFRTSDGETYAYNPQTLNEYQGFTAGDEYTIDVSRYGSITSVEKK